MMIRKLLVTLCFSFVLVVCTKGQSAWNKEKGSGYLKLDETVIYSDDFYSREGQIVNIRTTGVFITSIYGEYGISDGITGFIYFPFFFRNTRNEVSQQNSGITEPGESINSIGDSNIGLSVGLIQNRSFVSSISLTLGLPIGEASGGNSGLLQTGDGEFNQLLKIHGGYSFSIKNLPFFASASVGFNNRTEGFSDEFHFSFQTGATINQKVIAILKTYNITSLKNGSVGPSQTGIFSNEIEYFAIGPEVSYLLTPEWAITAGVQGAFSGKNVLASPSFSLGLSYSF